MRKYEVDEKTMLFVMRKRKNILLKEVAEHVGCTVPLLSMYENDKAPMNANKVFLYKEFIENY